MIVSDGVTVELLALIVGALLSLMFTYTPGLRGRFAGWPEDTKKLFMLIMVIVAAVLIVLSSCLNLWVFMACERISLLKFGSVVILMLVSNQFTDRISPEPIDVKLAKSMAKRLGPAPSRAAIKQRE